MQLDGEVGCLHYGLIHAIPNSSYDLRNGVKYFVTQKQAKYELLKDGDVVMVDASEDLIGVNKSVEISGVKDELFIAGLHTFLLRDKGFYQPKFRGAILNSSISKTQMLRLAVGMKVFGVSKPQLKTILIPIPPLPEQTAISNALSDMDALISQTEKLIEKKKAIKQGVMQELLKPKEGWVTKKLGEIGEISGAGVDKKIVDGEVPVRLVNYMDVYKRDFIYSNELSHWVTAPNQKLLSCQVRKGDVFFTPSSETREDIALPAVAMEDIGDAVYSYHLVRFRAFDNWDLRFKAYIFNTIQFLQQAEKQCEGSGKRYVLTLPKFRSLLISYPSSVEEQEKISDIIWDIDIEIQTTETKLQKLKLQKQGMMQALLTGKIRLI